MNWYRQAKIREFFNIQEPMDIKTAAIWSNLWRGVVKLFEGLGNLLFGSLQAVVSPIMTVVNLPLYSLIPFTPLLEDDKDRDSDPRSSKYMHCSGAMGMVCAIANLFRAVYNGSEAIVRLGLAAGETVVLITKKIQSLISQNKIDQTVDNAVNDYIDEDKTVDGNALRLAAEESKKEISSEFMDWVDRLDYEMGTLMEKHVVSLA
jgi:hypothetical protein